MMFLTTPLPPSLLAFAPGVGVIGAIGGGLIDGQGVIAEVGKKDVVFEFGARVGMSDGFDEIVGAIVGGVEGSIVGIGMGSGGGLNCCVCPASVMIR